MNGPFISWMKLNRAGRAFCLGSSIKLRHAIRPFVMKVIIYTMYEPVLPTPTCPSITYQILLFIIVTTCRLLTLVSFVSFTAIRKFYGTEAESNEWITTDYFQWLFTKCNHKNLEGETSRPGSFRYSFK